MARARLEGKYPLTINYVMADIDIADCYAGALGINRSDVLRMAVRLGLRRLIERDREILPPAAYAELIEMTTAPQQAPTRRRADAEPTSKRAPRSSTPTTKSR